MNNKPKKCVECGKELQNWFNSQEIPPVQDRKDGKDYFRTDNLYTETDILEVLEAYAQHRLIKTKKNEIPSKDL